MKTLCAFALGLSLLAAAPLSAAPIEIDWDAIEVEETFIPGDASPEVEAVQLWLDLTPGMIVIKRIEGRGTRFISESRHGEDEVKYTNVFEQTYRVLSETPEGVVMEMSRECLSWREQQGEEWNEMTESADWSDDEEPILMTLTPESQLLVRPQFDEIPDRAVQELAEGILGLARTDLCPQPMRPGDRFTRTARMESPVVCSATTTTRLVGLESEEIALLETEISCDLESPLPMGHREAYGIEFAITTDEYHHEAMITRRLDLERGCYLTGEGMRTDVLQLSATALGQGIQQPFPPSRVTRDEVMFTEEFRPGE
jgi:hypothetical protein